MVEKSYDLVVIGSGPAGYRAAVQAAKLDKRVCMVEGTPKKLGGTWIHTGTIPSKALRESMEAVHSIRSHVGNQWVERIIGDMSTDKMFHHAGEVSEYEESLVRKYFDRYGIDVIEGFGTLEDRHHVRVMGNDGTVHVVKTDFVLLSTGSRPRRPESIPFDGWRVVDADDILRLESLPRSLLIYGGGVIGCEYACIFGALGVETTIIDARSTIMQYADKEIADSIKDSMEKTGIRFALGEPLKEVKPAGAGVEVHLEEGTVLAGETLFFAAGRMPNTEHLGLERLGIETGRRGHIYVNNRFQTAIPNIYAAGDAIGAPALAATSSVQGRYAACHMFGTARKPFPSVFPIGIYTIPEVSSVGKTEEELAEDGVPYVVGRAHYSEVARGYMRGDHGLLKLLVCEETHQILGIHIVGHDACNLVHIGLAFMQKGGHAQDFIEMIFNYPTLAEAYRIAAFNALNKIFTGGEIKDPPEAAGAVGDEEEPEAPGGPKGRGNRRIA